jgi:hypothetical protein
MLKCDKITIVHIHKTMSAKLLAEYCLPFMSPRKRPQNCGDIYSAHPDSPKGLIRLNRTVGKECYGVGLGRYSSLGKTIYECLWAIAHEQELVAPERDMATLLSWLNKFNHVYVDRVMQSGKSYNDLESLLYDACILQRQEVFQVVLEYLEKEGKSGKIPYWFQQIN